VEANVHESSAKPRRRRWLRLFVVVFLACIAWGYCRNWELNQQVDRWVALAEQQHLVVFELDSNIVPCIPIPRTASSICPFPFLKRRMIQVQALRDEEADDLLKLPDCPVQLLVSVRSRLSASSTRRLQERFGASNVR